MFAYWRGLPESDSFRVEVLESASLSWGQCEDDVSILMLGVPSELTRGNAEQRLFISSLEQFEWFDPGLLEGAEQISPIRVAPETMRGFFREATGRGWGLVGDAGHFKHPSTAQGISDAIEQALHVAEALTGPNEDLSTTKPGWTTPRLGSGRFASSRNANPSAPPGLESRWHCLWRGSDPPPCRASPPPYR
jgi:hypothetical protein